MFCHLKSLSSYNTIVDIVLIKLEGSNLMLNVLLLNSLTPILSFLARDVGVNANIVVCRGRVPGLETAARRAVPVVPRSPSLQHTLLGQSRQGEDGVLLQCSIIRIVNKYKLYLDIYVDIYLCSQLYYICP